MEIMVYAGGVESKVRREVIGLRMLRMIGMMMVCRKKGFASLRVSLK